MDAKITKSRLGHMLSYDWIKILAICAVVVLLWILLFTTLAPRATSGQTFEIYVYPGVYLDRDRMGDLDSLHEDNALSGDVLDLASSNLSEDSISYQLSAWFAAGQGDVMFISSYRYEDGEDEDGNPVYTSDLELFATGYVGYCAWLGEGEYPFEDVGNNENTQNYLDNCENYLSRYYPDGLDGEMDKQTVEKDFRARIDGDNRYKRESQILRGLEEEYARLENLLASYRNVSGYLEDGTLSIETVAVNTGVDEDGDGETDIVDMQLSFDLSNVPGLENLLVTSRSEDGTRTSESVNMVILNPRLQEEALRYEQITFLDYLVKESARLQELES